MDDNYYEEPDTADELGMATCLQLQAVVSEVLGIKADEGVMKIYLALQRPNGHPTQS